MSSAQVTPPGAGYHLSRSGVEFAPRSAGGPWHRGVSCCPNRFLMKLISVVSSCYNEEENVEPLYEAVKAIFAQRPQYGTNTS